jgi:hypothetical protein
LFRVSPQLLESYWRTPSPVDLSQLAIIPSHPQISVSKLSQMRLLDARPADRSTPTSGSLAARPPGTPSAPSSSGDAHRPTPGRADRDPGRDSRALSLFNGVWDTL